MKTILVDAVYTFITEQHGVNNVFEGMHILLETYNNRKIVVTGADDSQWQPFGLDKSPYEVFTLKHNPEKTDPEYFRKLLRKYNLKVDEVLYFEHNPEAVKSAEVLGIKSYWYDDKKVDLDELKNFLDQNLQ